MIFLGEAAFENLDTRIPSPRKSGQLVDALSRLLGALDEVRTFENRTPRKFLGYVCTLKYPDFNF